MDGEEKRGVSAVEHRCGKCTRIVYVNRVPGVYARSEPRIFALVRDSQRSPERTNPA